MKLLLDSFINADEFKGSQPASTNPFLLNLFMGVEYRFSDTEKTVSIEHTVKGWQEDVRNPHKDVDIIYDTELKAWLPIPEYYLFKEAIEIYQQPIKVVGYMQGNRVGGESTEDNSYTVIVKLPFNEKIAKIPKPE